MTKHTKAQRELIEQTVQNLHLSIDACKFATNRMVDHFVIVDEDGTGCLQKAGGVWPISITIGETFMTKSAKIAQQVLADVKENNPDNHVAQRLKVGTLHAAAAKQREQAEQNLEQFSEMLNA